MVFSSPTFLFLFLPCCYILYRLVPSIRGKNLILILSSLLFYSFGRLTWVPLLLFSALWNYTSGRLVSRQTGRWKRGILAASVVGNLSFICVYKYAGFFMETVNSIAGTAFPILELGLPVGISFYTFQGMSYVIDVYREPQQAAQRFSTVLLYLSFFPQLVAGPIIKYNDIAGQLVHRIHTPEQTASGISRFILGLSKKLLLANTIGQVADVVYALPSGMLDIRLAWLGAVCYTLQIYFDFSGYSDMAIGLGRMFGFRIKENFRHPYSAGSVKDFWRRWHISLSSWFRDYLYIPLGGNRKGPARARWNRIIVFFLTGLWHGANWTFVIWGLWHGALLLIEDRFRLDKRFQRCAFGHLYTMIAVTLGFMVFRADSLTQAGVMLKAMFTGFAFSSDGTALLLNTLSPTVILTMVVGVFCVLPLIQVARERLGNANVERVSRFGWPAMLVLFAWDILQLASTSFNPFIYFQF